MFRFLTLLIATSGAAFAQPAAEHRLGEHPAVIVKRLEASRGYDYASKFYPHPAWLYLTPAPPDEMQQAAAARRRALHPAEVPVGRGAALVVLR